MGAAGIIYSVVSLASVPLLALTLPPYILPTNSTGIPYASCPRPAAISLSVCVLVRSGLAALDLVAKRGGAVCAADALLDAFFTTVVVAHLLLIAYTAHASLSTPKRPVPPLSGAGQTAAAFWATYLWGLVAIIPSLAKDRHGVAWGEYCRPAGDWWRYVRIVTLALPCVPTLAICFFTFATLYANKDHPTASIRPTWRAWARTAVLVVGAAGILAYLACEQVWWGPSWAPRAAECAVGPIVLCSLVQKRVFAAYAAWLRGRRSAPPEASDPLAALAKKRTSSFTALRRGTSDLPIFRAWARESKDAPPPMPVVAISGPLGLAPPPPPVPAPVSAPSPSPPVGMAMYMPRQEQTGLDPDAALALAATRRPSPTSSLALSGALGASRSTVPDAPQSVSDHAGGTDDDRRLMGTALAGLRERGGAAGIGAGAGQGPWARTGAGRTSPEYPHASYPHDTRITLAPSLHSVASVYSAADSAAPETDETPLRSPRGQPGRGARLLAHLRGGTRATSFGPSEHSDAPTYRTHADGWAGPFAAPAAEDREDLESARASTATSGMSFGDGGPPDLPPRQAVIARGAPESLAGSVVFSRPATAAPATSSGLDERRRRIGLPVARPAPGSPSGSWRAGTAPRI